MKIREVKTFQFDELEDPAKEKAREWFRRHTLDYTWWDTVYEDVAEIGYILGIDLRSKPMKLMNGNIWRDPEIYFDLDRAITGYVGTYHYPNNSPAREIREYAPNDAELHAIVDALQKVQCRYFYRLTAETTWSNHGMRILVSGPASAMAEVQEALQDFAHWIGKRLQDEEEYLQSNKAVDESILANDYWFHEDGRPAI